MKLHRNYCLISFEYSNNNKNFTPNLNKNVN